MDEKVSIWADRFSNTPAPEVLAFFNHEFGNKICLSSSMGAEDQVLTHMLLNINPGFRIFTLDTGRLFPETLNLIQKTQTKFRADFTVFFPTTEKYRRWCRKRGSIFFTKVLLTGKCVAMCVKLNR